MNKFYSQCDSVASILWLTFHHWIRYWLGPFHYIFVSNTNQLKLFSCLSLNYDMVMTTKFCTCHDSIAVMACAKFCSNPSRKNECHSIKIWIVRQRSLVGWAHCNKPDRGSSFNSNYRDCRHAHAAGNGQSGTHFTHKFLLWFKFNGNMYLLEYKL